MIGEQIFFRCFDFEAETDRNHNYPKKVCAGLVVDAYSKTHSNYMPNRSTMISSNRVYVVEVSETKRLIEIELSDVISIERDNG